VIRGLLREPLFHFLILGAAMFAASSLRSGERVPREDQIVVSAGQIEHLVARFQRTWRRPPTGDELVGLITDHVREEAAYREGLALGLDRDDTIIRRRIRQKLEFISADVATLAKPSEEELEAYLRENEDVFRVDPRVTFVQVFVDPNRHADVERTARELLATLRRNPAANVDELGDRLMLPAAFEGSTTREISGLFGQEFAAGLDSFAARAATAAPGWHGPLRSGYGLHLVRIDVVEPGRIPDLVEIRPVVLREWENQRTNTLREQYYEGLVERYEVTIEWPDEIEPGTDSR
jgi:hypothetical protein